MHDAPYDWVTSLPEGFDDGTSFRHMRGFAQADLARNAALRLTVVASSGEQAAVDEWDSVFEADNVKSREAIHLIDERMKALGLDPLDG